MTSDETPARDTLAKNLAQAPSSDGEVMDARQQLLRRREEAVRTREQSVELREQAVGAVDGALQAASDIDRLIAQLREANEQLVIATVQAQTAEEHAEEASHLKDDVLATVSHELRTPLNAVLGWARILMAKQLTPEREAHALDTIERNAASLAHIIDDLLDVSRIIAGRLQLSFQPVDIVTLTQAAVDMAKPIAGEKRIDLRFFAEPGGPALVSGDSERLQQLIWNLLTNAVKFTDDGGRVDVSIGAVGSMVELRVADTGQGISPDVLPYIFERFHQATGAPSGRHGGLGLGLAIVRQLVEMHGGSVRAVSEGIGRGATFTVRLPILGSDAAKREAMLRDRRSASSPGSPPPRAQRLDNLRILVVDDHDDSRTLTTLLLTQVGANVEAVATAREALQRIEMQPPDVLVSDIGLPDEDGYSLLRRIRLRQKEHGGAVPAIALTGFARADDRDRAFAAGFHAHIAKPVDPAGLIATIADVVRRSKS